MTDNMNAVQFLIEIILTSKIDFRFSYGNIFSKSSENLSGMYIFGNTTIVLSFLLVSNVVCCIFIIYMKFRENYVRRNLACARRESACICEVILKDTSSQSECTRIPE